MRLFIVFLIGFFVIACQTEETQRSVIIDVSFPDTGADKGDQSGVDFCEDLRLPSELEFVEGALVMLDLSVKIEELTLENGRAWQGEGQENWAVRMPYATPVVTLNLTIKCANGTEVQRQIPVNLKPLSWTNVSQNGSEEGPPSIEHPRFFIDPSQPDSLYIYGGYAFQPQQFTITTDLWRLDLEARKWTKLETEGVDPPPFAGGRMAYLKPEKKWVLVGGSAAREGTSAPNIYTLDVDSGKTPTWEEHILNEEFRTELGGTIYDEKNDEIVNFFGLSFNVGAYAFLTATSKIKCCDTPTVVAEDTQSAPVGRYGFAYFYEPKERKVIIFGGGRAGIAGNPVNASSQTHAFDLETRSWEEIPTAGEVIGGRNSCWAYDSTHRRLFIFGGTADGATSIKNNYVLNYNDDGVSTWHQFEGEEKPAHRASCTAIFDEKRGQILMGYGNDERGIYNGLHALSVH